MTTEPVPELPKLPEGVEWRPDTKPWSISPDETADLVYGEQPDHLGLDALRRPLGPLARNRQRRYDRR